MTGKVFLVALVVAHCGIVSANSGHLLYVLKRYFHYKCNMLPPAQIQEVIQRSTLIGPYDKFDKINKESTDESFFHLLCRVKDKEFEKGCVADEEVIENTFGAFDHVLYSYNLMEDAYGSKLKWVTSSCYRPTFKCGKRSVFQTFAEKIIYEMRRSGRADFCGNDSGQKVLRKLFGKLDDVVELIKKHCPFCLFRLGEKCNEIIEKIKREDTTQLKKADKPVKNKPDREKPAKESPDSKKTPARGGEGKFNIADKIWEQMEFFAISSFAGTKTCKKKVHPRYYKAKNPEAEVFSDTPIHNNNPK